MSSPILSDRQRGELLQRLGEVDRVPRWCSKCGEVEPVMRGMDVWQCPRCARTMVLADAQTREEKR